MTSQNPHNPGAAKLLQGSIPTTQSVPLPDYLVFDPARSYLMQVKRVDGQAKPASVDETVNGSLTAKMTTTMV
jgi:hypothetical protein